MVTSNRTPRRPPFPPTPASFLSQQLVRGHIIPSYPRHTTYFPFHFIDIYMSYCIIFSAITMPLAPWPFRHPLPSSITPPTPLFIISPSAIPATSRHQRTSFWCTSRPFIRSSCLDIDHSSTIPRLNPDTHQLRPPRQKDPSWRSTDLSNVTSVCPAPTSAPPGRR